VLSCIFILASPYLELPNPSPSCLLPSYSMLPLPISSCPCLIHYIVLYPIFILLLLLLLLLPSHPMIAILIYTSFLYALIDYLVLSQHLIVKTNGGWTPWSTFTPCSSNCIKKRSRFCTNSDPAACKGPGEENKACTPSECNGKTSSNEIVA
jgi:hypothetical protein